MNNSPLDLAAESRKLLNIDRVVMGGVLVSLLWKMPFFFAGFAVYRQLPLVDDFFPVIMRNPLLYLTAYLASVFCCTFVFLTRTLNRLLVINGVLSGCLFVLCVHQHTYNDVTFLTCFWVSLWSLWFLTRVGREPARSLHRKGVVFAHLVISLVFLGGALGKLTPGYWSGEVFYDIYFEGRDFWIFNLLRAQFGEAELRLIAIWHSRMVIIAETVCSALWLFPPKFASALAIGALLGIALMSNFLLFSVVSCLIGLAWVSFYDIDVRRDPISP